MQTEKIGLFLSQKRHLRGLLVGAVVFLLFGFFHILGLFYPLEWKSWDFRLTLFSKPAKASPDIVLILIDQYSLDVYEEHQGLPWPWPRQIYSAILNFLQAGGAKACVFDMLFSEGSAYGIDDDRAFAQSIGQSGSNFLSVFLSREEGSAEIIPVSLVRPHPDFISGKKAGAFVSMKSATLPVEDILMSAVGVGNVNFSPDKDGIYRRIPLLFSYGEALIPALALSSAEFMFGEDLELDRGRVSFRGKKVPLDNWQQMIIRYHGPQGTYKSYSAAAVINSWAQMEEGSLPQISPQEFAGKIVFVGTSAPGLYDLRPTPLSAVSPGVEIQATVTDNLLNGDFISVSGTGPVLFVILFLSLLTGWGVSLMRNPWKIILFFLFCLLLPSAASALAMMFGRWLAYVAPVGGVVLSFLVASVLNYTFEGRQKRFLKNMFRFYLSPDVIERIIDNPDMLRLGGEKREISSMFSDIAGFTSLSERLLPEELVHLLNLYLSEMTDIILSSQGTLDKYEGDAIIAFWNAPLDQPDHALRACRAVLRCQSRLSELRPKFKEQFGFEFFTRFGINSGPVIVGNMGSNERFDYTAIGDTVNLASRLEGACKQYGIYNLIGQKTYGHVQNHLVCREVDVIRVVGKKRPEHVYEILGEQEGADDSLLEKVSTFHAALQAYRGREWEKADLLLTKLEHDMLAQMYKERVNRFRESPPPENWDGVFELSTK